MAQLDLEAKSYFQIPPTKDNPDNVVLCNQGFRLKDIILITEVAMENKLKYMFNAYIGYSEDFKLEFVFERKMEALSCQRELTRAWSRTGEYANTKDTTDV